MGGGGHLSYRGGIWCDVLKNYILKKIIVYLQKYILINKIKV